MPAPVSPRMTSTRLWPVRTSASSRSSAWHSARRPYSLLPGTRVSRCGRPRGGLWRVQVGVGAGAVHGCLLPNADAWAVASPPSCRDRQPRSSPPGAQSDWPSGGQGRTPATGQGDGQAQPRLRARIASSPRHRNARGDDMARPVEAMLSTAARMGDPRHALPSGQHLRSVSSR